MINGQYGIRNPLFMYQGTYGLSLPTDEEGKSIKLTEKAIVLDIAETPEQCGDRYCSEEQ